MVDKSSDLTGESPLGSNKPVNKLDDQAFRTFGPRSRASSKAGSDASFCTGGPSKPACGEPVRNSDDGVQCEKCELWSHFTCQAIPKPTYEALKRYKVLSWFCNSCKAGRNATKSDAKSLVSLEGKALVSLEGKVDQLSREVKEHLGKMVQCLREQERSVDGQTKLIERSIRENVAQKALCAEMVKGTCSEVIDRVSAKLSAFPQLAASYTAAKDVQNMSRFLMIS